MSCGRQLWFPMSEGREKADAAINQGAAHEVGGAASWFGCEQLMPMVSLPCIGRRNGCSRSLAGRNGSYLGSFGPRYFITTT